MSAEILELPIKTARQVAMCLNQITDDPWSQACIIVAIYQNLPADMQASVVLKLNSLFSQREE